MPKRVGFLCEKMLDRDFIRQSIIDAAKHKHRRRQVRRVLADIDSRVEEMYGMVERWDFVPSKPKQKVIWDNSCQKERLITYVPFWPDGVMHTMMVKVMEPILMRGMYRWSCASIRGHGGSAAKQYVARAIRKDPEHTRYVLKMDIKQYYPSIDVRVLFQMLSRKIKDRRFLDMLWRIVRSCDKGLAIGFFPDQWLANFYLESLDRFIRAIPGVNGYVRYMDDMQVFGSNKRKLRRARIAIEDYLLGRLHLTLKANWQVFPIAARALDFVGYKFYRDHTSLRRRTCLRLMRLCRRLRKHFAKYKSAAGIPFRVAAGFLSRLGQFKHFDSALFRQKYLSGIHINELKEIVRHESKSRFITAPVRA